MKDWTKLAPKLRQDIVNMVYLAQSGHPGGSLSIIDILIVLYFGGILKYDSKNPQWEERDYFILSKGHASPALYAVLAEAGYFSKEEFFSFRQIDSLLQGHPVNKIPGVEVSTGSLGQGLSVACGIALGKKDKNVFVALGDGELQEGQVWEAAMTAAHYQLNNLIAIVDKNNLQIDGPTKKVMHVGDIAKKFEAFNWEVQKIDGHNFSAIETAFKKALEKKSQKPQVIVASTVKGKGISFMENNHNWHGKAPSEEEMEQVKKELG